jgi:membrane fusion protein (multidrug efflux system)
MELAKQAASIGHDVDLERESDRPKPCADPVPITARMNENGSMASTAFLIQEEDDASADQAPRKRQRRKRLFLMFAGGLAIAGGLWWGWATFIASDTEATENAYTNVEVHQVTPLVGAPVKRVLVVNSQHVRAGDTLVELDNTDLRLAAAQAEAALGQARRKVRQIIANDENLAGQEDARAADGRRRVQISLALRLISRRR